MRAHEFVCEESRMPNITLRQFNDDNLAQKKRAEWKAERAPLIQLMYGNKEFELQQIELVRMRLDLQNQMLELEHQKAETDRAKSEANERNAKAIQILARSNSDPSDQSQKAISMMAISAMKNRQK